MSVVTVRPNNSGNSHHLSWSALGRTYGIKLERGAKSIVEAPVRPSNIEKGGGVKKFGDFDPEFAHIEMRTWESGRGGEFLSDDPTKYFDGYGWSLTPGMWYQAPQWWWGEFNGPSTAAGTTSVSTVSTAEAADVYMPGANQSSANYSMLWRSLATTVHVARSFVQRGSSYEMANVQTWIRKIGTPPAPLNVRLGSSDDSQGPTATGSTGHTQLTAASVEELESFLWTASISTVRAQTGTTALNWWVDVWTSVAGTDANHWEIGYNSSGVSGSTSVTGTGTTGAWAAASTLNIYMRIVPAGVDRKWHFFTMDRSLYAMEENLSNSSESKLFINGDRGIQSSDDASAGSTAVLNDSSKTWVDDQWIGARIGIIRGPGAGQSGLITDNGSTSIASTWATAPTSISEYYIYDTNIWTEISTAIVSSIGGSEPVRDITVGSGVAYFAYGASTFVGSFSWQTSIHSADVQSTYFADVLDFFSDPVAGPQIVRGISSLGQVTRADAQGFTTVLTFSTITAKTGGTDYQFTNLEDYNNQMYAFKEDSIWVVRSDRAEKLNIGLDAFPSSHTGRAVAAQNLSLFFSWSHSLERLSGGSVDDIGLWRGSGLTDGHQGPYSALIPYIAWTLGGIDAGSTGISGAYAWNGRGWHEFYRSGVTGHRLQNMYMQDNPGSNPRLWMSVGGELICQRWPKNTLNPRNDGGIHYQHEAAFQTGAIDMNAVQLPKLFSKVHAITKNLASTQAVIYSEYQLDDDINTSNWLPIGNFRRSPIDALNIRRGNKHAIRLRFRGLTENSTIHSELHAVVLKAVGRTPTRRQWTVRAITGDFQVDRQGLDDSDPDDFYMWLQDVSVSAEPILQRAEWEAMDDIYVFAEHPILNRLYTTPNGQWGGQLQLTVREIEDD